MPTGLYISKISSGTVPNRSWTYLVDSTSGTADTYSLDFKKVTLADGT